MLLCVMKLYTLLLCRCKRSASLLVATMFSSGWVNTDPAGTAPDGAVSRADAIAGAYNQNANYGAFNNTRITGAHSTSSLARVKAEDIERSTKIVSVETASHLTSYEDPIKLIMPPVIQEATTVFVTRKFAVGNTASEVPERAPAPVVSVQEESRRVRLRRYGGDIDFNVNACAVPDMFKREMDLKVGAQHAALAQQLISLGYERLMHDGTDFVTALVRSSGAMGGPQIQRSAKQFYQSQVFGALGKHTYALANLLAAAKRCTAYDISRSVKTVMILPHGVPELMAYSKAENMRYEINGLRGPQGKPITMTVDSGYKVPASTASVFVHIPPARHMHSNVAPFAGKNELEDDVIVVLKYTPNAGGRCTNFVNKERENIGANEYRLLKLKMMHAILAVPGADTGNLLMQYPRSTVSADASTESGLMQLRVYMGAVLKRPENVLVMRNVAFNGLEAQSALLTWAQMRGGAAGRTPADNAAFQEMFDKANQAAGEADFVEKYASYGTVYNQNNSDVIRSNNGALGMLDDVAMVHRLYGSQIYDDAVSTAVAQRH